MITIVVAERGVVFDFVLVENVAVDWSEFGRQTVQCGRLKPKINTIYYN